MMLQRGKRTRPRHNVVKVVVVVVMKVVVMVVMMVG